MSTNQIQRRPELTPDLITSLSEVSSRATSVFANASTDSANVGAALEVAGAIDDLRAQLDHPAIRSRIVALQDTPLGFRTDRDPKVKNKKSNQYNEPYPWEVVRDCAIEAMLRGVQHVGNQWNIISGRTYITQEGFAYLIRRLKDVTDFKPIVGIPRNLTGGATVECEASWINCGKPQSLKVGIPVKGDEYSSIDQYVGKASRKLLKRCYEIMTGNVLLEGDANETVDHHTIGPARDPRSLQAGQQQQRIAGAPQQQGRTAPAQAQTQAAAIPPAAKTTPVEVLPPQNEPPPNEFLFQNRLAAMIAGQGTFEQFMKLAAEYHLLEGKDLQAADFFGVSDAGAKKCLTAHAGIKIGLAQFNAAAPSGK